MKFNKLLMTAGATILLTAGTYSITNLYYTGPKEYDDLTKKPNVTAQEIEKHGTDTYAKSLAGTFVATLGALMFVVGNKRNAKSY